MLESFRKKDASRPDSLPPSASPYGRMQEALSPTPPAASTPKPESPKPETPKVDAPRSDATSGSKLADKGGSPVSKLIVGPDIKLKGAEITDCDTLVVEGRVEAAMESRVLEIAEIGVFVGKASMDMAEIHGRFEGELTVRKHLVIRATGHVSGKIRYGKLAIEEGGELSGDVGAIGQAQSPSDNRAALAANKVVAPVR